MFPFGIAIIFLIRGPAVIVDATSPRHGWPTKVTIRIYQRFLSPYKGFCCDYAAYTGRASCSVLGHRAIRRAGVWDGFALLDLRREKCGVAHRRHVHPTVEARRRLANQGGFFDCGCCDIQTGCGMPASCDLLSASADTCSTVLDCASCNCNWRRIRQADDERYIVITPRS